MRLDYHRLAGGTIRLTIALDRDTELGLIRDLARTGAPGGPSAISIRWKGGSHLARALFSGLGLGPYLQLDCECGVSSPIAPPPPVHFDPIDPAPPLAAVIKPGQVPDYLTPKAVVPRPSGLGRMDV